MQRLQDNKIIRIIECPRDAMQGLKTFVPTEQKIAYLNALLQVGYHTLDCGSFVSAKAIPQMRDTATVLKELDLTNVLTKLSVIVANERGIDRAVKEEKVHFLGYPFSVSEIFQQRNTNRSMTESLDMVKYLQQKSLENGKDVVVYISMGFGNPYGEAWSSQLVGEWVEKIAQLGITHFSISDTVGISNSESIESVFSLLNEQYPHLEFGAHFHTRPNEWYEKVDFAWKNGCARFDGAIKGFGGCPMAKDELVGNMPTENLILYFEEKGLTHGLNMEAYQNAQLLAADIFE
jgi:hydroxymethylglutaryl-CoA lyase